MIGEFYFTMIGKAYGTIGSGEGAWEPGPWCVGGRSGRHYLVNHSDCQMTRKQIIGVLLR